VIAVILRVVPFAPLALFLSIIAGVFAIKCRRRSAFGLFLFCQIAVVSIAAFYAFVHGNSLYGGSNRIWMIGLTSCFFLGCTLTLIEALRVTRQLRAREVLQANETDFELVDLESQNDFEAYPAAAAVHVPATPAGPAAPIYSAAPAYYPQFNEAQPFIYGQPGAPQFVPIFVDASGKPIAPIHTQ
jgi:hypothetical protein